MNSADENEQREEKAFQAARAESAQAERDFIEAEGGSVDDATFAAMTGCTVSDLDEWEASASCLALRWKGSRLWPTWQVRDGRILAGIPQVVQGLRRRGFSPWTIASVILSDEPDPMSDASCLDFLRRGDVATALQSVVLYGNMGR